MHAASRATHKNNRPTSEPATSSTVMVSLPFSFVRVTRQSPWLSVSTKPLGGPAATSYGNKSKGSAVSLPPLTPFPL